MAKKQLEKSDSLETVAKGHKDNNGTLRKAALFEIDSKGNIVTGRVEAVFLLNPSTWRETKSANWVQQQVPGQSDPILQWMSSGPRVLSFEALVTKDTSYFNGFEVFQQQTLDPLNKTLTKVGDIAGAFFNITVPPPRQDVASKAEDGTDLDIAKFLNYYRSLLYPTYDIPDNPRRLRRSPPLLVLMAGRSIARFPYEKRIDSQSDIWVLTNLDINITKQLPNLAPMEATVSFQLTQYNIRSFDHTRFTRLIDGEF